MSPLGSLFRQHVQRGADSSKVRAIARRSGRAGNATLGCFGGRGVGARGIAAVVEATGIGKSRIRAGIHDLAEQAANPPAVPARVQRVRRPGAGRPTLTEKAPTLLSDLDALVDPTTLRRYDVCTHIPQPPRG